MTSLPLGVVTLAERFGAAGFTEEGFQAMVDDVGRALCRLRKDPLHRPRDPRRRRPAARHQRHRHDAGGRGAEALPATAGRWWTAAC